ncbi:S41 family peptidase [Cohnella ginsengisoli]|uniref:S41 family peptidase n=1 Tax=Cohnella ginsengisoli TaxID=425004 RepID=A0A9X4KDG6_9BACL|nr:S41 family peptidase [Cohnella ginsengisoli]MDG0789579.1 S41 family peptidase [Cohnella ginsengisoli]
MRKQKGTAGKLLKTALCLALSVLWLPAVAGAATQDQVNEVRQLLEEYHISKPTDDKLNESGIEAMIGSLDDPYTQYFSPEELQSFSNAINQSFVGIGIVMSQDDGITYLEDVVPDSPAFKAGLMPGDALVSIDGAPTAGKSIDAIQVMAAGKEGTTVNVGVKRGMVKLQFLVSRTSMQLPVATSRLMGAGVGYLRLDSFSADAAAKFKTQLQFLEGQGMTSLVVDLRGNGGGYVDQAQQIGALFVADGILAHVADRDGKDTPIELHGEKRGYPVYILVDGGSASATELLSGALQEYGVAKLVGTKTYGKGVIQQLIPVASGGTLKVTVQEYKTPGGKKVDKVGLTPDVAVTGSLQQLLAAYRLAGGGDVRLTVGRGALVVNGIRTADAGSVIKKNGVWYISSKLGAVASEAKLSYDAKARQIVLDKAGTTHRLNASDSHVIVKNGVSYIDVRLLSKWFANLTWAAVGDGTVTLYDSAA